MNIKQNRAFLPKLFLKLQRMLWLFSTLILFAP